MSWRHGTERTVSLHPFWQGIHQISKEDSHALRVTANSSSCGLSKCTENVVNSESIEIVSKSHSLLAHAVILPIAVGLWIPMNADGFSPSELAVQLVVIPRSPSEATYCFNLVIGSSFIGISWPYVEYWQRAEAVALATLFGQPICLPTCSDSESSPILLELP